MPIKSGIVSPVWDHVIKGVMSDVVCPDPSPTPEDFILQEDGYFILQEDGFKIVLEEN